MKIYTSYRDIVIRYDATRDRWVVDLRPLGLVPGRPKYATKAEATEAAKAAFNRWLNQDGDDAVIAAKPEISVGERFNRFLKKSMERALADANQVTGQERLEKSYSGLHLPFLGFSDFQGGGRVAELKVKTSPVSATAKSGRRAGGVAIQAGREARPASRLLRRRPRLPGQPDLRVGNRLPAF